MHVARQLRRLLDIAKLRQRAVSNPSGHEAKALAPLALGLNESRGRTTGTFEEQIRLRIDQTGEGADLTRARSVAARSVVRLHTFRGS